MDKVAKLPAHQRKELFQQTAAKMPWFSEAAIEKDFWVCWILKQLFNSSIQDVIIFKGGTSLSKIFHLIQRFSEDIDLILNWKDNTVGDPMLPRSHTSQTEFNKNLDIWSGDFVRQVILPEVQKVCSGICQAQISQDNPEHIVITYPKSFEDQYLRPQILLEIGAKAAWVPHDTYTIRSYAAEAYPRIFDSPETVITATTAERSFWEKITILHAEAHRPPNSTIRERYSRHYYDTVMIARSPVKQKAFSDLQLLKNVAAFKEKFYYAGWANYKDAKPGSMKLLPPPHCMEALRKDYQKMQMMIYGNPMSFDEILESLKQLEEEINHL